MNKHLRNASYTFLTCAMVAFAAFAQGINFGNDDSDWANDGECDDPRFEGTGMALTLLNEDRFRDRTDCQDLFNEGLIWMVSDSGILGELGAADSETSGSDFVDRYELQVPKGPEITYEIDLRSASLDTVLRLYRQGEDDPIAENDDYRGDVGHSHLTERLSSGIYELEVSIFEPDVTGAMGTYSLNVNQVIPVNNVVQLD